MGDAEAFGGTFATTAPPERQAEYAARIFAAFAGTGTSSDALLIFAEMAEEASWHAEGPHRLHWHSLARLLRVAAPAFGDVPLRTSGLPLPPPGTLAAAARSLRAFGTAEERGAAELLDWLSGAARTPGSC